MTRHLPVLAIALVFLAGYALCAAQFPAFLSTRVIANLLTDNAFLGIVAVGMTFVIVSGGIDLSVGSVIGFTTVFLALSIERCGMPPVAAFGLALLLAALFGAAQGAVIELFDLPPFIVTLAGMFLARGASFLLSTESIPVAAPLYEAVAETSIRLPGGGRLTMVAILMVATFAAGGALLHLTRFGTIVYALGGSRLSTGLMGIRVGANTIAVYTLSGCLAGLAGIVFSLYTSSGYSLSAIGVELDTIAAVVIGGTLLTGGHGLMVGTFLGVMVQGLIQTYITFDGTLSSWWAKIATGILLFAFIGLQAGMVAFAGRAAARRRTASPGSMSATADTGPVSASLVVISGRRAHSNHAEIARALAVDIITGRFPSSSKLPGDAELMLRFGVSRPVLRESVKTLVAKGLLTTKARVGTVVRERSAWNMFDHDVLVWHLQGGIDRRFLNDLGEIRLAVEPRAAALAAERRTEQDLVAMRDGLEAMRRAPSDSDAFADGDLALHLALATASGNPFMRSIGAVIDTALRASFVLSAPVAPDERDTVLRTHQEMLDAIARRDPDGAAATMIAVIHNGLRRHATTR